MYCNNQNEFHIPCVMIIVHTRWHLKPSSVIKNNGFMFCREVLFFSMTAIYIIDKYYTNVNINNIIIMWFKNL